MKRTNYCSKCKTKDVPLIRYSYSIASNTQYHVCRSCNSARKRKWNKSESGRAHLKEHNRRYHKKNAKKNNARNLVNYYVSVGNIIKPKNCSKCGATGRIEGHHFDYSKPLDIVWVCTLCHNRIHSTTVIL